MFSSRQIRRERVDFRAFLEKPGVITLSVARLTYSPPDLAVVKADAAAAERPGGAVYGWGVIVADKASANGRSVPASPAPDGSNPYHADLILPELAITNREVQKIHAQMPADLPQRRARPDPAA